MTTAILTDKTETIINRILEVDNFQNMACCCSNWKEFTEELEEWGVTGCAKIEFDDEEFKKLPIEEQAKEVQRSWNRHMRDG